MTEEAAIHELKPSLRGELIGPSDESYDAARKVWNGMIDKHPSFVVRCAGVADVINAVRFARKHNILVAVRGGGHNVAGNATCDGGLLIDLSRMKFIRIDPVQRIALAQPGLTWGEFDHETQAFGLALTGGIQSTTGVAGFTLGGGFGYLARKHGLTCDNLLTADVVTADGDFLTTSEKENSDLFWGIRGGGGNFGIVTSFEFRLHPLGQVLGGMLIYPMEEAQEVIKFYREYVKKVPDELFTILLFFTAPEASHLPKEIHGKTMLAVIVCYSGDISEGNRVLEPLRKFKRPTVDLVAPKPYKTIQTMLDAANPPGLLNYWKAEYIRGYDDEAIETILAYASQKPSRMSKILVYHLLGAISRVGEEETAYTHRKAPFLLNINAMLSDSNQSEKHIQWARDFWTAMQRFSAGGVYVNFLSNEGEDRVKAAYTPKAYERLVALKNKYDPTNVFHLNQNIKPNR